MDRLTLPKVSQDTSIDVALSRISQSGKRAVVVDARDGAPRVVVAGDILEERNKALDAGEDPGAIPVSRVGTTTIGLFPNVSRAQEGGGRSPSEIMRAVALGTEAYEALAAFLSPLPGSPSDEEKKHLESFFAENDSRYFVQLTDQNEAVVVTASEKLAAALSTGLSVCKCSGNPVHSFEPWQLDDPDVCNKPHRKPITCGPA